MPVSGEEPITSFFPRLSTRKRKENVHPIRYSTKRKRVQIRVDADTNEPPTKKVKAVVLRDAAEHPKNAAQLRPEDGFGGDFAFKRGTGMQYVDQPSNPDSPQTSTLTSRAEPGPWPSFSELKSSPLRIIRTRKSYEVTFSGTLDEDDNTVSNPSSTSHKDTLSVRAIKPMHVISTVTRHFPHVFVGQSLQTPPPTKQLNQKRIPFSLISDQPPIPSLLVSTDPRRTHISGSLHTSPTPGRLVRCVNARPRPSLFRRGPVSAISTKSPEASKGASGVSRMPSPILISSPTGFSKRHHVATEGSSPSMLVSLSRDSDVSNIIDNESDMGPTEDPFTFPALSQVVPSSQTLDVHFAYPQIAASSSSVPVMGLVTDSPKFKFPALPIRHQQPSLHGIGEPNVLDAGPSQSPEHRFVPSSQTQYMLPYDVSPRRVRPLRSSTLLLEDGRQLTLDEVVSSSQSQIEKELSISTGWSQLFPSRSSMILDTPLVNVDEDGDPTDNQELLWDAVRGRLIPRSTTARMLSPRLPERSSSEEKIMTPVHEPDFMDLFEESSNGVFEPEGQATLGNSRSEATRRITPTPNSLTKTDRDDSATESDAEHDVLVLPALPNRQPGIPVTKDISASPPPLPKSPTDSGHWTSYIPNSDDSDELQYWGDAPNIPDAAAGLGSIANTESDGSFGSLPEVVKEFRDMFGSGEGSYPDDFPMSLR